MAKFVLALDQGTTSSRAIVFDEAGRVRAVARKEFEQIFPRPGWVEHDPNEIWSSQISVAQEALRQARISPRDVAAIGITNQRETAIVWDRATGEPVANAIVWQDRRTADLCDELRADGLEDAVRRKTGLVIDAYFSATKVRWLLDHVDGARGRAERGELAFGTVDSWLIWKLTGGALHITDVTNASRTMLYDIHHGDWDDELLAALRIPRAMLPDVRSSSESYAETAGDVFATPIPIAGIAGDQQAALFGQMCITPGMAKNTYGTGAFVLIHTGTEAPTSKHQLITTPAWRIGEETEYALEGSIFIAGAVVQWLRDGLQVIQSAPQVEHLAASVEDNGGVVLVPAFAGLGAPHWDPHARGLIAGITRGTTAGHLARAALESIAYQTADVVEAMEFDAGLKTRSLRADGGAAANNLLMQFQADVLGVPIERPTVLETTALGAAYLAGLAVGYWPSRDAIAAQWRVERTFEPAMKPDRAAELRARWREAVERAKNWST
jgi:glycerol kinase